MLVLFRYYSPGGDTAMPGGYTHFYVADKMPHITENSNAYSEACNDMQQENSADAEIA